MIIVLEIQALLKFVFIKKKMSVFENLAIVKGLRKGNEELQKG